MAAKYLKNLERILLPSSFSSLGFHFASKSLLERPFNNYVDKMRGSKMSVFVHAQDIKSVHEERGQKMAKFCPRSC